MLHQLCMRYVLADLWGSYECSVPVCCCLIFSQSSRLGCGYSEQFMLSVFLFSRHSFTFSRYSLRYGRKTVFLDLLRSISPPREKFFFLHIVWTTRNWEMWSEDDLLLFSTPIDSQTFDEVDKSSVNKSSLTFDLCMCTLDGRAHHSSSYKNSCRGSSPTGMLRDLHQLQVFSRLEFIEGVPHLRMFLKLLTLRG